MKEKKIGDMMTCVEKRHMSHRVGGMLHHRFPNGFTDLLMDETDREVSTLTDRAFRSLCIGDDAVYNDEFTYGYSPFSCHKPLAGEPPKKTAKEAKKHGHSRSDKHESHQQKTMSQMSSFLKALSATEESYGGMFKKNGVTDSNGESWDKSALRSIQKELSEFSTDYHTHITEGHYKKHQPGDVSTKKMSKDNSLSSGNSSKSKNFKSNVKLKKLNIKNFFLHSEFSPFQAWADMNRFSFAQETIVNSILPEDPVPKWYDLPFYKELTEAPEKETALTEQPHPCEQEVTEPAPPPPPPTEPKPIPPPVPPKVLPKPVVTAAEKRCTSECGDGTAAPWRRNRSRATSAVPITQPRIPTQDTTKQADENLSLLKKVDENLLLLKKVDENLTLFKKEARSVEVKTVEEVNSLASTPFSICQLMTPIIPSRQPTETSEILTVLSPSALELALRPQSEAKVTPEPPLKRDSYKSLASSILFNLKDNRKRVKSRYSPRKFKTLEETESGSPLSDHLKPAFSEGLASGMSTPAIVKDVETIGSPLAETNVQSVDLTKHDAERPLSNDYLLSHLLQSKPEVEASPMSPLLQVKKNKSHLAKKQNYPSLNLYKKASPVDSDMKYLQVPLSPGVSAHTESVKNYLSPPPLNKDVSPLPKPKTGGLLPNTLNVNTGFSPESSSPAVERKDLLLKEKVVKRPPDVPEKPKRKNSIEPISLKDNNVVNQSVSAANVIKAARDAINAAKHKALTAPDSINKLTDEINKVRNTHEQQQKSPNIIGMEERAIPENLSNAEKRKEPPPVPKRTFTKSDIPLSLDSPEKLANGNLDNTKTDVKSKSNKKEASQKQGKLKHIFSARQNNYIKNQRYAIVDKDVETEESDQKVSASVENDETEVAMEIRDGDNIISDLNALKELERARLAERIYDNAKNKFGVVDIVEQTKARNDLISRELRNIKKGMLSMRGNTMAKKELFSKKESEQGKGDVYSKLDGNVIVNKALINDNYDKAKMALEEIIFEREKRKNLPGQEESDQDAGDESHETNVQKHKTTSDTEVNGLSASDLKERLTDLRDHNNIRHILSQTEPRLGETHRAGSRIALPGMDKVSDELNAIVKSKSEKIEKLISNYLTAKSNTESSQVSEETVESTVDENTEKKHDAPPVPPRSRKGSIRRDSVGKEAELSIKNVMGDINKNEKAEQEELCLIPNLNYNSAEKQNVYETEPTTNLENAKHIESNSALEASINLSLKTSENENKSYLSQEVTRESKKQVTPLAEIIAERKIHPTGTGKVKRRAPLRPDHLSISNGKDNILDQSEKICISNEDSKPETDLVVESPQTLISPLLLINGVSVCQSPPDQASLSSKSSYFSAESTLHRNTETESNVYHSLENLIGEIEEAHGEECGLLNKTRHDSDRTDAEYYSFSDHESEPEPLKKPVRSPQEEAVILTKETGDKSIKDDHVKEDENNLSASSNPVSPTFAIPALFKVKDNTFSNKLKKSTLPWSPRGSLAGIEALVVDDKAQESHEEHVLGDETLPPDHTEDEEVLPLPPPLILPISPPSEILKVQDDSFLRVPEQQDRNSEVSPLSDGLESTVETADEMGVASGLECELSKVPSERSGSTCSGNDSQTGLPKPPAVLPKSEKAVLRAIKLTNRRIKKEEAHKSVQKPSHSSSKSKSDKHKSEKSEHKSSSSSRKSGERKHKQKTDSVHPNVEEKSAHSSHNPTHMTDIKQATQTQSVDSDESSKHKNGPALLSERLGRSSDKRVREKPEQRHYSSDRIISNVPVYKTYVGERPRSDRPFQRSLSTDRYMENKVERRLSADMSANDRLDPRSQRIEKSIMDEIYQRGRQKDKQTKETPLRRSHSIDSQSTNVLHPPNLSRQSSNTSQFSRQSSIEHAIVAPSFPMTQRKLLQDPDSGQYFFVDMPVQVKTKTFFDPETGTYVQFPIQPPEGAIPQPSPMEVLSPPLMVYHSFVPVSLSPMAQATSVQVPHVEYDEYEQRHLEVMTRHTDGHPYLEPVFGQHEHMLGEFLGTEELDCPS